MGGGCQCVIVQVVFVVFGDFYVDEFVYVQWYLVGILDVYQVVDFWGIGFGVGYGDIVFDGVDQVLLYGVDFGFQVCGGNLCLFFYEVGQMFLFYFFWYGVR